MRVAEMQVGQASTVLTTIVGSSVGIALYDEEHCVGGLAHVMLPLNKGRDEHVAKYANTAIPALATELERTFGSARRHLRAKVAGGATMHPDMARSPGLHDIGNKTVTAARYCLESLAIPIVGEAVGFTYGRRLAFHVESGILRVTTQGQPTLEL